MAVVHRRSKGTQRLQWDNRKRGRDMRCCVTASLTNMNQVLVDWDAAHKRLNLWKIRCERPPWNASKLLMSTELLKTTSKMPLKNVWSKLVSKTKNKKTLYLITWLGFLQGTDTVPAINNLRNPIKLVLSQVNVLSISLMQVTRAYQSNNRKHCSRRVVIIVAISLEPKNTHRSEQEM